MLGQGESHATGQVASIWPTGIGTHNRNITRRGDIALGDRLVGT